MSDTRGSLPNNTMGLLLMVKVRDLDQATGGRSNVGPRDRQVDMIKMMDPVGLMVRSPHTFSPEGNIFSMSDDLRRGVAYS